MPITQIIFMLIVAALVTLPVVWLIPRQRQSPAFDRLLWAGTFTLAFIGAWLAPGYLSAPFSNVTFSGMPWLSILLGSAVGALALNLLLWLLDRFERPEVDDDETDM